MSNTPETGSFSSFDIGDNWRVWIAENLMLGGRESDLLEVLRNRGVPRLVAKRELREAINHPYLRGARRLHNRLQKREWLLDINRCLNRLTPLTVERRHRLDRETFFKEHYVANRPVIVTGAIDAWPAMARWTFEYFRMELGEESVEVQLGRNTDENYEINSASHRRSMRFADYIDLIQQAGRTNDFYMTANNSASNRSIVVRLTADILPLPEYLNADEADRWFFWFGPSGTFTPLHHDLTNNLMAQVVGGKRVWLAPPCETADLYNENHCFSLADLRHLDDPRFPDLRNVQWTQCDLAAGELLFLPIGWWHSVESLDVSITATFTNFRWSNDYTKRYPSSRNF
jgi:hypothetical protein